ncbi:MAG TPA: hypothetical protein VFO41_06975 [Alphaproteobacteria bacterium]|nr:hypothetical protein [Alphaproteobacteria bacterium]
MHHWTKRLFAIAAPLLLTGCLWGPGKFASDLTLRKNGTFVLDYRGEMVIQLPPDATAEPWTDAKAKCSEEGKDRPCTRAEIDEQKSSYEKKLKDSVEMAKVFGLPGLDDESNRAFAAKLMKYAGWRSVTYRGKGVFDVDYHFEGSAAQDFLFPALPDNDLLIPFVAIRRRADGAVLVTAPAMTGGAGPLAARIPDAANAAKDGPVSRADGRFTVHTDGQIMTNNSEDGPAADPLGQQLRWDVSPASRKVPETLVRL